MAHIGVAGAGFSGAVIARELAEAGHSVTVFDSRDHIAGNCHTGARRRHRRDGPRLRPAHLPHPVRARLGVHQPLRRDAARTTTGSRRPSGGRVYSLPVNLLTINQFFGTTMGPAEAAGVHRRQGRAAGRDRCRSRTRAWRSSAASCTRPSSPATRASSGAPTRRPAGEHPAAAAAAVQLRRQLLQPPVPGDPGRRVHADRRGDPRPPRHRGAAVDRSCTGGSDPFDHVVWTGPIDDYFEYEHGRLALPHARLRARASTTATSRAAR